AQSLKLTPAYVVKIGAVRTGCGALVEVHRQAKTPPYLEACLASEHDALLQLDVGNGNERNDVGRTDARVHALLSGEIDQLYSFAGSAYRRLNHGPGLARDGHDGAVVVGVHRPIEQPHPGHPHRGYDRLDATGISTLREIGNALDNRFFHGQISASLSRASRRT